MSVERPRTTREQVDQMWYALIGLNGDGLISKVNRIEPIVMMLAERRESRRSNFVFWLPLIIGSIINLGMLYAMLAALK